MLTTATILLRQRHLRGGDSTLVTVVYVLTAISLIVGFIIGTYKYVQTQKKKWTEEGTTRAKQAQVVEENSKELKQNTELSSRFPKGMNSWMAMSQRT